MFSFQRDSVFKLSRLNAALCAVGLVTSLSVAAEATTDEVMVVTASQTKHPELTAPASVSYITREELDELVVNDVAEAVRKLPGININPGTTYGRNEIKIRGLDSDYTLLLINGRRINSRDALTSAYGNDFDLSSIPMSAVERIEVIRGPMSSLYGADALGGVVNVILRQPTDEVQGQVGYQYDGPTEGSGGDTHKWNVYASGSLIPNTLLGNIIIEQSKRDAWRTDKTINPDTDALEERDELNIFSTLKWLVNDQQDVDLEILYSQDDRDADWNNWGMAVNNVQKLDRTNIALIHNGYWSQFDSRLRYNFEQSELEDDSELNGAVGDIKQTNNTVDVQLSGYVGDHLLTGGAEYRNTELKNNLTLTSGPVDYSQSAIYLQDEISFGDLAITLGGRFDDHEVYGGEFSPRAYAVYSMTDNWVVKGGVGKAFKAPGLNQYSEEYSVLACRGACRVVGNPDLKAETSVSYELGTSYQAERWGAGLTLFQNDIEDMIQAETWDRVKTELTYFNVDEAKVKGVELLGWFDITDTVSISANYMYTDAKDETTDKALTLTPEHTANVQLDWQVLENLYVYTSYQYTGEQYVRIDEKSDAYGTLDLGARYTAMDSLNVKLGVTNLTDEDRDDVATSYDYILKSRSIYAGVSYDF
ncbi:TonB-dependent receptor domain-containing protein [Photobacterium rosenbergii]|uniref:TonB-dependent receptor n=1 Tax=Photobacterium rosenbergii TaxID=294936 RepID=A0ABU3ZML5_9GAMM|nr:TonB-dependent receptor [Photobacterium rosenbergii]MDV5171348.1 TonB-dependent receptor [Photobacterium rosenbergii]